MNPYIAVFISSLFWAISTQVYSKMVDKLSVYRFNLYKSVIAFVCFLAASYFIGAVFCPLEVLPWLLLSGFCGFFLADLFIFYSFAKNGPARTLMFAAFEPSMVALYAYLMLGITLPIGKVAGLVFLLLCLVFIALERRAKKGTVSLRVVALALIGINIEAVGVVLTKKSFMMAPEMSSMTANLYRVLPAVIFLPFMNYFLRIKMGVGGLSAKTKMSILGSTFLGTFVALYFYLYAISKYGHPSIIAGLGSLTPIYASIYEHWRDKKYPNRYFVGAIVSMVIGVLFLVFM